MRHSVRMILPLALLALGCDKEESSVEGNAMIPTISEKAVEEEFVAGNVSMGVGFERVPLLILGDGRDTIYSVEEHIDKLVELHYEVLPAYVFEGNGQSGDYYAVHGYAVAHNGAAYGERRLTEEKFPEAEIIQYGWYMGRLRLGFQLLSPEGEALNTDQVQYFVTPEPSTTIGTTTYKKGFGISLGIQPLTIGAALKENPGEDPSWKSIYKGKLSLGFKFENSSTQVLPDQSVEMSTDPWNRAVTYDFRTNNVGPGYGTEYIPVTFRTDQRVDFSFVWYVPSGNFCAKDRDFGSMKMKVSIAPGYLCDLDAYFDAQAHPLVRGKEAQTNTYETVVNLPSINRIPTAEVYFKNTTRSYVTNLQVWRTGEYSASKTPYHSVDGTLDTNEEAAFLMREGQYDFVYELVNGDTGESRGTYIIRNVELTPGSSKDLSTLKGKKM